MNIIKIIDKNGNDRFDELSNEYFFRDKYDKFAYTLNSIVYEMGLYGICIMKFYLARKNKNTLQYFGHDKYYCDIKNYEIWEEFFIIIKYTYNHICKN